MGSTGSTTPPLATFKQSNSRQKSITLKHGGTERESNPYVKYRSRPSTFSHTLGRHRHATTFNSHPHPVQKRAPSHHWDYINPVLGMCSILMIQNPFEGHQLITAVKHILRQALYRDRISAPALIRIVTGYCFIAEQDFSLSLVNVFGEFVVQELKISIQNHSNVRYDEEVIVREDEMDDTSDLEDSNHHRHFHHPHHRHHHQNNSSRRRHGKDTDKDEKMRLGGHGSFNEGAPHLGRGHVGTGLGGGVGVGGGGQNVSGRTKILAHNFHVLHHLLIWDLDPSYNLEWTRIKWEILGSMRFPPGHPILFPGATDALRQVTASIIADWVDT
ncbi:hypothetical protein BGX24_009088 [Mortierella sp. AD032]|nr:hypothetical protein BGX24_009088 [Mortierella sp. AD032]